MRRERFLLADDPDRQPRRRPAVSLTNLLLDIDAGSNVTICHDLFALHHL